MIFLKKIKSDAEYDEICACCEHCVAIRESDMCVCRYQGAVYADGTCGKFTLDLLKLDPKPKALPEEGATFLYEMDK